VLDYDSAGNLVGIDIDNASAKVQMDSLTLSRDVPQVFSVVSFNHRLVEHMAGQKPISRLG